MFLTRKIGGFLRGKATRGQVFAAALLAGVLGFVPGFFLPGNLGGGFAQAPGLILSLLFLVLVLNANLGVFALVTLLAKLCSLLLLPVSFAIGRALIDGPLQGLFKTLANGPVTAWFGLEYYATTGGLVLGLFFGTASGWLFARTLMAFRHRMARAEESSELYQKHAGKKLTRFLAWILFGKGKSKKVTWQELAESERRALPVRIVGIVLVVLIGGGLWTFQQYYSTPLLTEGVRGSMQSLNGATVDLGKAQLDLASGSLKLEKFAIADSKNLAVDLFSAGELEARIDTGALLRRRLVIDRVAVVDAKTGGSRSTPGQLNPPTPEPPLPPPDANAKTIDDYLKDVELWRGRLVQLREWIGKLSGSGDTPPAEQPPEVQRRRIEAAVEEYGMASVAAEHLRDQTPLVWIRSIDLEGVACMQLRGAPIDLHAKNLSSDAWLLREPPTLSIASKDGKTMFGFTGPSGDRKGAALDFALRGLSVDELFAQFKISGASPVRGGTFDVSSKGSLLTHQGQPTSIDLPLQVTMRDTTFALAGAQPTTISELVLPVGLRGPVSRPTVALDDKTLADALLKAGKQELANFVQGQAGKLLGGLPIPGAGNLIDPNKTPEQNLEDAKKAAEDAANKAVEDAKKKAEEAAKKAAEDAAKKAAEEAAKKGIGEGLKGLLPGGKKKT